MKDLVRVTHRFAMKVEAPAEMVFPLMCPVRERDWIEGWECEVVYSESGVAELGCVFLTDLPGRGVESWMVTRYEPNREIEFCRTAGTTRACHLRVSVEDHGDGTSSAEFTYTHTGVDEAGRRWTASYTEERFEEEMLAMRKRLRHYLREGEMLRA